MASTPLIPGGYILTARRLFRSAMMDKPPLYFKLWGWMLDKALWKDGDHLQRGQLVTNMTEMQEAMSYRVGYRKETPTKGEIRSAYEAFAKAAMITTAKTTIGMVVTILNYDLYQNPSNYEAHSEQHNGDTTKRTVTTQHREEGEERRKKKNTPHTPKGGEVRVEVLDYDDQFAWFCRLYPKKGGNKKKAREKFVKTVKTREHLYQIYEAVKNYKAEVKDDFADRQYQNIETFMNNWTGYIPDDWPERWAKWQEEMAREEQEEEQQFAQKDNSETANPASRE